MSATAATLVNNGVAPKRAVSADLTPVGKSVATATGIRVQAMYPPTISTTPTAKRQPSPTEGLSFSTTSSSLPFSIAPCYARIGPKKCCVYAPIFAARPVPVRLMHRALDHGEDAFAHGDQ